MNSSSTVPSPEDPVPPQPIQADFEAEELLKQNDVQLLDDLRGRAEKWAGGLTALTGLISTVLFIEGPTEISDVPEAYRLAVAALVTLALLLLIGATICIYVAAYGSPYKLLTLDRQLSGLGRRLILARETASKKVLKLMQIAIALTLLGVGTLFGTTLLTWFAEGADPASANVCIDANGMTVKLGELQAVTERHQLVVVPCPS